METNPEQSAVNDDSAPLARVHLGGSLDAYEKIKTETREICRLIREPDPGNIGRLGATRPVLTAYLEREAHSSKERVALFTAQRIQACWPLLELQVTGERVTPGSMASTHNKLIALLNATEIDDDEWSPAEIYDHLRQLHVVQALALITRLGDPDRAPINAPVSSQMPRNTFAANEPVFDLYVPSSDPGPTYTLTRIRSRGDVHIQRRRGVVDTRVCAIGLTRPFTSWSARETGRSSRRLAGKILSELLVTEVEAPAELTEEEKKKLDLSSKRLLDGVDAAPSRYPLAELGDFEM